MNDGTQQQENKTTLRFVIRRLREKGIVYCFKAAVRIFARPIVRRIGWIFPSLRFLVRPSIQSEKRILAIYDFRTHPWTVGELLYFQQMTLMLRVEHNIDKVDMIWLCDPSRPKHGIYGITPENYHYHLSTLLPLAQVNPHLGSFLLMDSSQALESYVTNNLHRYHVFPPARDIFGLQDSYRDYFNCVQRFYAKHGFIPHLSCKPAMVKWAYSFIEQEVRPHLPVVVHLRNRSAEMERNAKLEDWSEFFTFCQDKFNVKFILISTREEIDPRFRGLENVIFSKDYSTTVEQDMALIQASLIFLGTRSGTWVFPAFSNLPYILFNFRTQDEDIPHGSVHLLWATSLQRLVWEPETTESLIDEFTNLFNRVDKQDWEERAKRFMA